MHSEGNEANRGKLPWHRPGWEARQPNGAETWTGMTQRVDPPDDCEARRQGLCASESDGAAAR